MTAEKFEFTNDNRRQAADFIAKYPDGRQASAVMPLLDLAQKQNGGWLPRAAMEHVAEGLEMPPIRVYEVATFYTMYNLKPVGEHHVQVCTNLPCWLRGSDGIAAACKKNLGVDFGETTADGKFTLSEVECLGACVNAPMMQVGDDFFEDLDAGATESVLNEFRNGGAPKPGPQSARKGCEPASKLTTLTGPMRLVTILPLAHERAAHSVSRKPAVVMPVAAAPVWVVPAMPMIASPHAATAIPAKWYQRIGSRSTTAAIVSVKNACDCSTSEASPAGMPTYMAENRKTNWPKLMVAP